MPETTTTTMYHGSKIVNGDRALLVFIKTKKSFIGFNVHQQQCFHEAYNNVHNDVNTLSWQKLAETSLNHENLPAL